MQTTINQAVQQIARPWIQFPFVVMINLLMLMVFDWLLSNLSEEGTLIDNDVQDCMVRRPKCLTLFLGCSLFIGFQIFVGMKKVHVYYNYESV